MLATAFLFGLVSSLHCIGMCGPIALMLPLDRKSRRKRVLQIVTYQLGRISSYAAIGLFFGLLGRGFYLAGFQQKLSIAAGIAMLVIAIIPERNLSKYNFSQPVMKLLSDLRAKLGKLMRQGGFKSLYGIGVLNGLLPCGMVYAALFGAIAMQDVVGGMMFMVFFGLGTFSLMSAVPYFHSLITMPWRNKIQKAIPYAVGFIGVLFIIRGLGLGIPYLSPSDISLFVKATADCR